jgi:nifR3 family TIM-barrel protein
MSVQLQPAERARNGAEQLEDGARFNQPFSIGSLEVERPLVLAPMAAITDLTYRRICRDCGAGLAVTEAAYAHRLLDDDDYTWKLAEAGEGESPLIRQLYGRDPETMAAAAVRLAEDGAECIDLNCGCPMPKIVKKGIGAALLQEPDQIASIIRAIHERVDLPVTAKIRAGWKESRANDIGRILEDAGCAAIMIHGRTREDRYELHADLDSIRSLKETVSIPVIGNGDVACAASARHMFQATGCDAVMVGRAAIGNPWVFSEIAAWLEGDPSPEATSVEERRRVMHHHLACSWQRYGDRTTREFRKHMLAYVRGTGEAEDHVRSRLREMTSLEALETLIDEACERLTSTSRTR